MTKPRLRKAGDGWECRSEHVTPGDQVFVVKGSAGRKEEAFQFWRNNRDAMLVRNRLDGFDPFPWPGFKEVPHRARPDVIEPPPPASFEPRQGWLTRLRSWLAR